MNMIQSKSEQQEIKVGKWTISDTLGIISSPEEKSFVLEPRLSRLLYLLAVNERSIISREYLTENIWPDTIVNEESLTRAVADLRKFLTLNFAVPPKIETIRKRGYQLTMSAGPRMIRLRWKVKKKEAYTLLAMIVILSIWLIL